MYIRYFGADTEKREERGYSASSKAESSVGQRVEIGKLAGSPLSHISR